ncbi:MAG: DUF2948 family protein [Ahrensia sp.]
MKPLKLMALDREDLTVIAAQVQDAITKPAYFEFSARDKRFTIVLNRFAWDAEGKKSDTKHQRRQAALSFAQVTGVRSRNVRRDDDGQILNLLTVRFVAGEAPSGIIELLFADGPAIELDVACIEVQLADLGGVWGTRFKPRHPLA